MYVMKRSHLKVEFPCMSKHRLQIHGLRFRLGRKLLNLIAVHIDYNLASFNQFPIEERPLTSPRKTPCESVLMEKTIPYQR